jgi:hypothetical protein
MTHRLERLFSLFSRETPGRPYHESATALRKTKNEIRGMNKTYKTLNMSVLFKYGVLKV